MIGFECPWCDQRVTLHRDALASGSITCLACQTQVDLVVGPVTAVWPGREPDREMELLPAA